MSRIVTIVDYGSGNLLSVSRAFEHWGAEVLITDQPQLILKSQYLVLPGVGSFESAIQGLESRSLLDPLREYASEQKPFLGICLGMQLMLDRSEEFGSHAGLGLINGEVIAVPPVTASSVKHKIPHIGWNELVIPEHRSSWSNTILSDISPGESVYFVHSYTAVPRDPAHRLADSYYDGCLISAAIQSGSLLGCQFHPEKSGDVGLRIIKRFLEL
jgi:imidazole glycerol-phosphate synthase subunit HisH